MLGTKDGPTEKKELVIMTLRRKYVNSTLLDKKCTRCSKVFPRTSEYFYPKKHRTNKGRKEFDSACIKCENERTAKWRVINAKRKNVLNNRYRNSERGYFMELWNSTKQSKHGNEFKDFDSFFNHWVEQQKTYGTRCPYLNIEMTRKKGMNKPGFRGRTCPTNISRDRVDSSKPYSPKNLMFCSWKANDMKGSITPLIAKRYLGFYKERFSDE